MMTYKGLPRAYNKDLQEDKEPLFDTFDTVRHALQITTGVLSTLTIHPDRMFGALDDGMLATDVAEYLVRRGVPFRQAHHISGSAVRLSESKKCSMRELTREDWLQCSEAFDRNPNEGEVNMKIWQKEWWNVERSVESRNAVGGTSLARVQEQIKRLKEELE
jgi:argininosuccinate lyase